MGESVQRQRPDAGALDDHVGVGVHPGQELAAGVGQVDLGTERPALDVQGPGGARDGGRKLLVAVRLDEHGRLRPDVDVVGVPLGDVDEDPDDVGAVDHVDRRGSITGRQVGSTLHCRGVARGGQDEVAGVGIAGHDHAVVGGGEREVAHPCLRVPRLALGDGQVGPGDRDVNLGLCERGLFGEQFRLRLHDGRLRRVPRGGARLPLVGRLEEDLGVDHAPFGLVRSAA